MAAVHEGLSSWLSFSKRLFAKHLLAGILPTKPLFTSSCLESCTQTCRASAAEANSSDLFQREVATESLHTEPTAFFSTYLGILRLSRSFSRSPSLVRARHLPVTNRCRLASRNSPPFVLVCLSSQQQRQLAIANRLTALTKRRGNRQETGARAHERTRGTSPGKPIRGLCLWLSIITSKGWRPSNWACQDTAIAKQQTSLFIH